MRVKGREMKSVLPIRTGIRDACKGLSPVPEIGGRDPERSC